MRSLRIVPLMAVLASSLIACSSDDEPSQTAGSGGSSGSGAGGSAGSGGSSTGAGGSAGSGGSTGATGGDSNGSGGYAGSEATDAGDGGALPDAPVCGKSGAPATPAVPEGLAPPAGATLLMRFRAQGTQIYTCKAGDGGAYAWTFKAPDAKLYDETTCPEVGTHFAGPTWKSNDGSSVVGAKVASVNSPLAGAIPWLLLKAVSHDGAGIMANVTAVQRLDTIGGAAPSTACDYANADMDAAVGYTANYYFYTGGTWSDPAEAGASAVIVAASVGDWTTYPDPYANGQPNPLVGIGGNAIATKTTAGAHFEMSLNGLPANRTFGAHLHKLACDDMKAGGHYQNDPAPPDAGSDPLYANSTNEVWLDFTGKADGTAVAKADVAWVPRAGEAKSIVVHDHGTAAGGVAGAKLACLRIPF